MACSGRERVGFGTRSSGQALHSVKWIDSVTDESVLTFEETEMDIALIEILCIVGFAVMVIVLDTAKWHSSR